MTFRQFAFNNIFRNKRTYAAHFLSSTFSIMIFFTYALLLFHPDLAGELKSTSATISELGTIGFRISQGLIFVFSFFFILYSVSSFLKTRKKEFGILMMQGMSMRQLRKLVLIENMLIGVSSIFIGIVVGLIFSKLVLLISASILSIRNGLPFYIPFQAIVLTVVAFFILFFIVSLFTMKTMKVNELVELIQAEEKPKPEPKASVLLSVFSVICIGSGYGVVLYFVLNRIISTLYPLLGTLLVIIGTYFLYTQCSVFILRMLKRRAGVFFHKTNILTFSELIYRMKDNAVMFFIISIISAVSFTAIGISAALGNKELARMTNPYTFIYTSSKGNDFEKEHISEIKKKLEREKIDYKYAAASILYTENGIYVMKLSEYNALAKALSYETETLKREDEILLIPSWISQQQEFKDGQFKNKIEVIHDDWMQTFHVKKALQRLVFPHEVRGILIAVKDSVYEKISSNAPVNEAMPIERERIYGFVVEDWLQTKEISKQLNTEISPYKEEAHYSFQTLTLDWLLAKQKNGLLFMVSVLVGIVFFTFAASFIYFRLYADLDRDQQQYKLISKMGLSKKELRKIITRQLVIMFFLPILVAIIHTSVAFIALQQLLDFSILNSSSVILISFLCIQIVYFFVTRWRYLQRLYKTMDQ
ncbi:ABC transporter permease [Bacillus gaemokensis]|uniref:ABC transporter permease n=1 Tax=Bacillus gaemokensis TaxID=574375 RepID=A0A073K674_9BACI|nr:ABC transporter permease [Bacillus gaemokensis]KEK22794.1 ABC transporter permease [Bacillus gaemokensis]KYG36791.1 ABC transporter permease [Bacillus gaemokensis]